MSDKGKPGLRTQIDHSLGYGGKIVRLKGIFTGIGSVIVALGIVGAFSFNSWQAERNARKELVREFSAITGAYVEYGKKARLDIVERGHYHTNKSEDQRKWEGQLFLDFKNVLGKVTQTCPAENASVLKELRCANTRYFSCYDAMKERQTLSQVVRADRLKADCGSAKWSALTRIGNKVDLKILDQEAEEQFRALQDAQASAERAIVVWSELSFFEYLNYRARSFFVH